MFNKNENDVLSKSLNYSAAVKLKESNFDNLTNDLELSVENDTTTQQICSSIIKDKLLVSKNKSFV